MRMGNGCGVRREDGVCLYVYSGERERERGRAPWREGFGTAVDMGEADAGRPLTWEGARRARTNVRSKGGFDNDRREEGH